MTKKEIERKTEGWVKSTKEDLDRILYFVKNNEKGMGYEHAMTALQSIASYCYNLAKSFKDWTNEDRQGKLEESTSRRSFKKFMEAKKIVEDNSWTTADGSKIEVKQDKVFKTTKDGKKFWMPRYTWEHAFDDDGDIENGPSRREPTWLPVK